VKYIWNKIDYFDPEILEEMVEEKIMIVYSLPAKSRRTSQKPHYSVGIN